jgi:predicted dehydrogenase
MAPGFAAAREAATLVAVASRSKDKAEATATRHNVGRAHGSYENLLADPDVEAVYIPLPNDQHCEWTLRALEAGKHVLCDKPGALTYADAVRMASAARAAGLRLMEGFMCRHHPQHARVAETVASGEVGEAVHFTGTFTYPAEYAPGAIRWSREHGGGALLDTGVYPINVARLLFGAEPIAVSAVAAWDEGTDVDRHTIALLEWADGRTASVMGGFDQAFTTRYEVRGRSGVVTAERAFQVGDAGVTLSIRVGDDTRTEHLPHVDQYGREIEHFSRCVRDPSLPLWPGEDGAAQARVVEAVIRSARERRRVALEEVRA